MKRQKGRGFVRRLFASLSRVVPVDLHAFVWPALISFVIIAWIILFVTMVWVLGTAECLCSFH